MSKRSKSKTYFNSNESNFEESDCKQIIYERNFRRNNDMNDNTKKVRTDNFDQRNYNNLSEELEKLEELYKQKLEEIYNVYKTENDSDNINDEPNKSKTSNMTFGDIEELLACMIMEFNNQANKNKDDSNDEIDEETYKPKLDTHSYYQIYNMMMLDKILSAIRTIGEDIPSKKFIKKQMTNTMLKVQRDAINTNSLNLEIRMLKLENALLRSKSNRTTLTDNQK